MRAAGVVPRASALISGELGEPIGGGVAGQHAVDGDAIGGDLVGDALEIAGEPGAQGVGQHQHGLRLAHRDGGDGHQPPPPRGPHGRQAEFEKALHRQQQQLAGGHEVARRSVDRLHGRRPATVGDDDLGLTKEIPGGRHHPRGPIGLAEIDRDPGDLTTGRSAEGLGGGR